MKIWDAIKYCYEHPEAEAEMVEDPDTFLRVDEGQLGWGTGDNYPFGWGAGIPSSAMVSTWRIRLKWKYAGYDEVVRVLKRDTHEAQTRLATGSWQGVVMYRGQVHFRDPSSIPWLVPVEAGRDFRICKKETP
jgi:hypothetical protein